MLLVSIDYLLLSFDVKLLMIPIKSIFNINKLGLTKYLDWVLQIVFENI